MSKSPHQSKLPSLMEAVAGLIIVISSLQVIWLGIEELSPKPHMILSIIMPMFWAMMLLISAANIRLRQALEQLHNTDQDKNA